MFKIGDKVRVSREDYIVQGLDEFTESLKEDLSNEETYKRNQDYRINELKESKKDNINPSHYQVFSKEAFEMMIDIWGVEAFKKHCEMTAFKYRMRAGYKDDPLQDLNKAKWYENKIKEL